MEAPASRCPTGHCGPCNVNHLYRQGCPSPSLAVQPDDAVGVAMFTMSPHT